MTKTSMAFFYLLCRTDNITEGGQLAAEGGHKPQGRFRQGNNGISVLRQQGKYMQGQGAVSLAIACFLKSRQYRHPQKHSIRLAPDQVMFGPFRLSLLSGTSCRLRFNNLPVQPGDIVHLLMVNNVDVMQSFHEAIPELSA